MRLSIRAADIASAFSKTCARCPPSVPPENSTISGSCLFERSHGARVEPACELQHDACAGVERGLPRRCLGVFGDDDPNGGETLWEPWIDGFERAMRLRPDAWEEIALSDDEEASASVSMIIALNDFYYGRSELTEEAEDELDRMAPGLIPEFVRNLNAWTKSRQIGKRGSSVAQPHVRFGREEPTAFGRKVGRNESCPCGSSRKYKRCCGAH